MDEQKKTDELIEFTDNLMAGRDMKASAENQELIDVVQGLYDVIKPSEEPSDSFREQLKVRLEDEWRRSNRVTNIQDIRRQRLIRQVSVAAGLILVFGIVYAIGTSDSSDNVSGTASGGADTATYAIIGVALLAALGVAYWFNRNE